MKQFDYVIIGAGSSGCVMAYRLSADPAIKVLLIEAGPPDKNRYFHIPKGVAKAMSLPESTLPYQTEVQVDTGDRGEFWTRGKTLGGSSAINGMMYVRGQPADYDEIAEIAGDNWNWEKIGKAYKELENHELGAAPTRGDSGPLNISMPAIHNEMTEAMIEAGVAMGLPRKNDVNEPDNGEAVGYAPCTIYKGRRQSAAVAFLRPIASRPNLEIATGVTVDKLLFSGNRRITGLTGTRNGAPVQFDVTREVLLAAGALASPAILMRSGIGPADHLRAMGIDVLHDGAGVGGNLREHRAIVMQWRVGDADSANRDHRGLPLVKNIAQYVIAHSGVLAQATYEIGAWFKTKPELARPDGQFLLAPYTFDFNANKVAIEKHGGLQICAYILRPESAGRLSLRSKDPAALPIIAPDYHSSPIDRLKMIDVVRYARDYVHKGPLAGRVFEETRPGPEFETDDQIIEAYNRFGNGAYHASGTCMMGLDRESVVDELLRVRGVEGVRVIDTSILPFIPAGNTQGPAMAMAWRAADLILAGQ